MVASIGGTNAEQGRRIPNFAIADVGEVLVHGVKANRHSHSWRPKSRVDSTSARENAIKCGVGKRCWERAGGVIATGAEARIEPGEDYITVTPNGAGGAQARGAFSNP